MAIIPSNIKFVGISPNLDTIERKSARLNSLTEVYTLQDFADSIGGGGLKLLDDALMTDTLTQVVDKDNTPSVLRISTTDVTNYGGGAITSNTAFGDDALINNISGSSNTAIGVSSLNLNTTGVQNTALGLQSLANNVSGSENTAIGVGSLRSITSTSNNTAIGSDALYDSTGSDNTAIGYNTGRGITTGSNNTILGANVTGLSSTLSNNIIIADGSGNRRINVDSNGNVGIGNSINATGFGQKLRVIG